VLSAWSDPSRCQDAELVALGIGEYDPGLLALSDVPKHRALCQQAVHLRRLIVGSQVQVQTVLGGLRLADRYEDQTW